MQGVYYEDLRVRQVFETDSRKITQYMILKFAELTGDKNPIHLNDTAAKEGVFDRIVAHGRLTGDVAIGLLYPHGILDDMILVSDFSEYKRPVYPDNSIRCVFRVSAKRPHKRLNDHGQVYLRGTVLNQDDKPVLEMKVVILAKRKTVPT
jgi:3-hydroxybutyryl-CoA dehydratase